MEIRGMTDLSPTIDVQTAYSRKKQRIKQIDHAVLDRLVKTNSRKLTAEPRFISKGRYEGTYALATNNSLANNVLEVYQGDDGTTVGFLFVSLDTWLTYPNRYYLD